MISTHTFTRTICIITKCTNNEIFVAPEKEEIIIEFRLVDWRKRRRCFVIFLVYYAKRSPKLSNLSVLRNQNYHINTRNSFILFVVNNRDIRRN